MCVSDLPEVLDIESEGHPRPWSEKIFREELAREWARLVVVRTAESLGTVAAYCNYWVVIDEVQLLNIVTAHRDRRRGYAQLLLHHIFEDSRSQKCTSISLEVRRSNLPAIALYRSFGFAQVGLRARYYADNGEDALAMRVEL